jgi:uncharacterized protein with PQ loop repeat
MAGSHAIPTATASMGRNGSTAPWMDSSGRFFATHFGVFVVFCCLTFYLSQAIGWGVSATWSRISLPHAVVLAVEASVVWLPHAILMAAHARLRRVSPLITASVGAVVLVAILHAIEFFVQVTSRGASTSGIGGWLEVALFGVVVATSLLTVAAIGRLAESRRPITDA